jgi:hypothetical protein
VSQPNPILVNLYPIILTNPNTGWVKVFDALIQESRKPDSELAPEKYEDFVEVRNGLLVPTVLQCIVKNAWQEFKK